MMRRIGALAPLLLLVGCSGDVNVLEPTDAPEIELADDAVDVDWVWSANVGDAVELRRRLEPALANGRVFAAGASGRLAAFDATSGDRVWRRSLDERSLSGGPAASDDLVVIGTREGKVLGFEADDGESRWVSGVTSEVLAPAAIGQDSVVVRTNDGRVFALEPASGERRWLYDRSVPPLTLRGHSAPVLVKGGVLAGFDNGRLVALKLADGTPAWEATVAVASGSTDIERMVDIDGDPRVEGSQVFATSYQGRVAGIALGDGNIAWTRDISSYNGVGLDEANVYVSDSDGRLWALDRSNGATVWRQEALDGLTLTPPRRYGEHLIVGGSDGYLYWLSPDDGSLVARREIGDTRIAVAPRVKGRWVYVQTVGGELVALRRPGADRD